jgi:DNA topoisomerase-1
MESRSGPSILSPVAKDIRRKRRKRARASEKSPGFDYFSPNGKRITAKATIEHCDKLAIPPAWKDVWISPSPTADLQATGRDAKKRLQYRYHKDWTEARAAEKFEGMTSFARILPSVRRRVDADLKLPGMPKARVVALVVKLIDLYHFRIGNDEYARQNKSYGLTTLVEGHMTIDRSARAEGELDAVFEFAGKSGKLWKIRIWEDEIAHLIHASGKIGGLRKSQDLFRFEDESGLDYDIKSNHINEYLDASTPGDHKVTAKDFRTWAATWKAASWLSEHLDPDTGTARKRVANQVVKLVASDLGNTPAICRSSYVHPAILSDWGEGSFRKNWNAAAGGRKLRGLSREETATLLYLE